MKISKSLSRLLVLIDAVQPPVRKTPRQTSQMLDRLATRMADALEQKVDFKEEIDLEVYNPKQVMKFIARVREAFYGKGLEVVFTAFHFNKDRYYRKQSVAADEETNLVVISLRFNKH